jgi:putative FmdB family regulatory protein
MPTYEYECKSCGHAFEAMHGMTVPALRKCPKCGKLKLVRLISGGAGVIFKGSGFYETDYKKKRGTPDKPEPSKDSAKPEKTSESKSDAKTESKPDTSSKPKKDAPRKD